MAKQKILLVDDDVTIVKFVRANLEANKYAVTVAINGKEALQMIEQELPDLVLLDIMMPEMDGFEVCRRLREWSNVPIIMLTARGDEIDKVRCLEMGADDYISKPFGVNELMARAKAVLRRAGIKSTTAPKPSFTTGELEVNFNERRVTVAGKEVKLTPTEYNLLQELALNAGKVLTHTHLLQKIWGPEYQGENQYLHVFVRRLRIKLESEANKKPYITTVSGVGYKLG
ncbi:MAG: response regulator transcription factor [Dehalococcoidales bacterium]|nr:response regulator transcription factor [Dehalococcoidales bacterium]